MVKLIKMKKILILLISILTLVGCKKETKSETQTTNEDGLEKTAKQSDGLTLLIGEFVYYADAAVLQTHAEIYGVVLNDKVDELNNKAKPFKKEPTDFVLVEVRGKISQKTEGEEGWDNLVEIKEILSVSPLKTENNNLIKLGNQ